MTDQDSEPRQYKGSEVRRYWRMYKRDYRKRVRLQQVPVPESRLKGLFRRIRKR